MLCIYIYFLPTADVQLSAFVALADAVPEAVVHQSRGRPAGLQDPAHALGGRDRLLPWKGMSNLGPYFEG